MITLGTDEGSLWSTYTIEAFQDSLDAVFSRDDGLNVAFAVASHPNSDVSDNAKADLLTEDIAMLQAYYVREGF